MSSATMLAPRFRLGDWVSYPVGFRRALAQIVEDRGPVGIQGRRLYRLQIDRGEDGGTSIEVPESDLAAPPEITTAELARKNGLSTQNWPRQAFHATYKRPRDARDWRVRLTPVMTTAVPPMVRGAGGGWEYAGGEGLEIVRVDVQHDPRLIDVKANTPIWANLIEDARRIADLVFHAKHPKATVISEPGDSSSQ
jgi:hypothetical protein